MRLRDLRLMTRLALTGIVAFVAMVVIIVESIGSLDELLFEDRSTKTRHLVEVAHGVVENLYAESKAGRLSEAEAKAQALRVLKTLRYEKTEYFWVNDLGKPFPKMIMHPTVPALDGKVLDEARFNKAVAARDGNSESEQALSNKNLFVAFVDVVEKSGHGFVTYLWPKPKAGGGVTEELFPKISYVKKFEPWGWVIGSGIYVDDLNALFWHHARHSLMLALVGTLLMMLVAFFIRRSIVAEFGGEPRIAMKFAQRISDGDLSGEIKLNPGDRESLLFVLSHMQASLREMLKSMIKNAHEVQASVEKLSAESNQITLATQVQSSVVSGTRNGVEELSASVDVVNALAGETETSSQEVARRSQEGAVLAEEVSTEMLAIASTVERSSQEVSQLVERTQEINKMAAVIKEIANQTNLLALNAAIEAARAGEQGRGFAVVADEVRKLAERTTVSTVEIARILQAIQGETSRAVKGMNDAAPVIASGVEKATVAATTLREIEQRALDSLGKMKTLAEATTGQTRRITEIVERMDQVTESTARTESAIQQSQATSVELEHAASEMFEMTKRFNVGSQDGWTAGPGAHKVRPLLEWSPALSVGFAEIDRQHIRLIEIANELNAAMQTGKGAGAVGRVLGELVDYTVKHFAYEENLMKQHNYGQRDSHLAEHKKLIADVSAYKRKVDAGQTDITVELLGFVRDWLVKHIMQTDMALGRELNARGLK
jgi:methyl-accepting chemotaxis protein